MNMRDRCSHLVRFPEENCATCLAAEVERLKALIDEAGKPWLRLDPGIPWEGAIDAAMTAACAEIEKLREEVESNQRGVNEIRDDCERRMAIRLEEIEKLRADVVWAVEKDCRLVNRHIWQVEAGYIEWDGTDAGILSAVRQAREGE